MANSKPIDQRMADFRKKTTMWAKQAERASKKSDKLSAKADKAELNAKKEILRIEEKITAEVARRQKLMDQHAKKSKGLRSTMGGLGIRLPALKALPGLMVGAAIGGIIGAITAQMREAISTYTNTLQTSRGLASFMSKSEISNVLAKSTGRGFGIDETLALTGKVSRAVGAGNRPGYFGGSDAVGFVQQKSLETGVAEDAVVGLLGSLRRAGVTGFAEGQKGLKQAERVFSGGFASALEKNRIGEHLANMDKAMASVGEVQAGIVNVDGINSVLAGLGRLGAGFQGQRGFNTAMAFQNAMVTAAQGGGDPAAQARLLRSVGGFGAPGSNASHFQARLQLEKGISDPNNVRNLMQGIINDRGGTDMAATELQKILGISLTRSVELITAQMSGEFDTSSMNKKIEEVMTEARPVEERMLDEIKSQSRVQEMMYEEGSTLAGLSLSTNEIIARMAAETTPLLESILSAILEFAGDVEQGWEAAIDGLNQIPGVKIHKETALEKEVEAKIKAANALAPDVRKDELDQVEMWARNKVYGSHDNQEVQGVVNQLEDARRAMNDEQLRQSRTEKKFEEYQKQAEERVRLEREAREINLAKVIEEENKKASERQDASAKAHRNVANNAENAQLKAGAPPPTVSLSSGSTQ